MNGIYEENLRIQSECKKMRTIRNSVFRHFSCSAYIASVFHLTQYVVRCTIWYYLYNLKNMKDPHGGVLFMFFELYKWYQIVQSIAYIVGVK